MRKTAHLSDITIDQWKIDKIRNYSNGGWEAYKLALKLDLPTYAVVEVIYDNPIQTTMLGSKTESYYEDEMDYAKLAKPEPLPNYRLLLD